MAVGDDLVAYYKCDVNGTFVDQVNAYNGSLTNAPTFAVAGKINGCYDYNGSSNYVTLPQAVFGTGGTGTLNLWVEPDLLADHDYLISHANSADNNNNYSLGFMADGDFRFGGRIGGVDNIVETTTGSLDLSFQMITVTSDGTNVKLYRNGVLQASTVLLGTDGFWFGDVASANTTVVGALTRSTIDLFFNGKLDEIVIWDGTAKTQSEITKLFNGGNGLSYDDIISASTLEVVTPNGGENLVVGNSYSITWTDSGAVANVRLEYSTDNGASYSDVVVSTVNDGSYSWLVPDDKSVTCFVRVSDVLDATNLDVSDVVFSISGPPDKNTAGGSFVQSWLMYVRSKVSGALKRIREQSNQMILQYEQSDHLQITSDFRALVVKVHDGDTVTLRTDFRSFDFPLRIANIDALEMNSGGEFAKDYLSSRILGRDVIVKINPFNRVGKYGRLIGEVFCGGFNVGEDMLRRYVVAGFGDITHRLDPKSKWLLKAGVGV